LRDPVQRITDYVLKCVGYREVMSTAERICEEPPGEAVREVLEFVEILKARHGERGEEGRTPSGAEAANAVDELRALTGSQPLTLTSGDAVRGMRDEARYY
jgi:hypothetical protein